MIGLLNFPKVRRISREVNNYFFLMKSLDKMSKLQEWKECRLRKDWVGRIYTVISLREEDMGEQEEVRNLKVLYAMKPINEFLTEHNLNEIIAPSILPQEGTQSYIITYTPMFDEFSQGWVASNLFLPAAIICETLVHLI